MTGSSGRVPLPPGIGGGLGRADAVGDEAGFPLLRRGGGEGGAEVAGGGDSREIDL